MKLYEKIIQDQARSLKSYDRPVFANKYLRFSVACQNHIHFYLCTDAINKNIVGETIQLCSPSFPFNHVCTGSLCNVLCSWKNRQILDYIYFFFALN